MKSLRIFSGCFVAFVVLVGAVNVSRGQDWLIRNYTPPAWQADDVQWSGDISPHNKIDDKIDSSDEELFDVVVNYKRCVSDSDIAFLNSVGQQGEVQMRLKYISSVAVGRLTKEDVITIADDPDVAFIQQQFGFAPTLDESLPNICVTKAPGGCLTTVLSKYDGSGINIAIMDSGVDNSGSDAHDAFLNTPFIGGYDAITKKFGDPDDDMGHGTHVACIALGQATANTSRGVAPGAGLIDVRVYDAATLCSTPKMWVKVADGLEKIYDNRKKWNVDVINMSFGSCDQNGPVYEDGLDPFSQLVDLAESMGIVVVASAGNNGPGNTGLSTPAAATRAITVAASETLHTVARADDRIADYSSRGPRADDKDADQLDELKPEVAAPGRHLSDDTFDDDAADGDFYAWTQTTSSVTAGAGVTINVTSSADIAVGDIVRLYDPWGFFREQVEVTTSTGAWGTSFTATTTLSHPASTQVVEREGIFAARHNTTNEGIRSSGTSMAAPHVAGLAALIMDARPGINAASVKNLIIATADLPAGTPASQPTVDSKWNNRWGWGLVNAGIAVDFALAEEADLTFPTPSPSPHWLSPDIITTPSQIKKGQKTMVTAKIRNKGPKAASDVRIHFGVHVYSASTPTFYDIGTKILDIPVDATGHTPVSVPWTPKDQGHQCLRVEIGYGPDTDYSNNTAQRNIQVAKSPVRFEVRNTLTEEPAWIDLVPTLENPGIGWTYRVHPPDVMLAADDCPVEIEAELYPPADTPPGSQQTLHVAAVIAGPDGPVELGGVSVRAFAPWPETIAVKGVDIGGPEPPGSIEMCAPPVCDYQITAGGTDIWGSADQFYYAYTTEPGAVDPMPISGDFTALVAVKTMEPYATGNEWAKAGIMARQNLEPGSPHAMVLRSLKNGVTLQGRSQPNQESSSIHMDGDYGPEDTVWLRLDRAGNTFTGSYAIGGETAPTAWTASSSREVPLPPVAMLGLASTSHEQGVPIEVAYSDFCIGPYTGPPILAQPGLPDSPAGGDGYMGIREVIDNEAIGEQSTCYESLFSGMGTIVDYTASVLNIQDSGGNGNYGNDNVFGVVTVAHRGQGAADDLSLIARGAIRIPPDQGGIWTFGVNSDDGFTLQFPGQNFLIGENGEIMNFQDGAALRFYGGRGVADTLGVIELPSGDHPFWLTYHEGGGDAAVELFAAKGAHTSFDPDVFRLVGHKSIGTVPIPGFCNEVTMVASRPGAWGQTDSVQDAMDAVAEGEAHGTNSIHGCAVVNHSDPEDGAADPDASGSFGADLVFPNDQPGDDNDFAVMVEGLLDIPAAGTYQIGFNSDDGAGIQIFGHQWESIVPGSNATAVITGDTGDWLITDALTGWSWTAGEIEFAAPGCYEFRAIMFERGGGSFFELFGRGVSRTAGKPNPTWHLLETDGAGTMQDFDGLQLVAQPVAYWKFDEGEGTIAQDCSGYGHDARLMGDPCRVAAIPINIPGIALHFDGIDDYVDCGTFNPSAATGQITVAAWARWNGPTGQWQGILGKRDTWAADDMMWQIECDRTTGVVRAQRQGIADIQEPSFVLQMGKWEHVAFTFDGTIGTLYRNGAAVASGSYSFGTDSHAALVVGACEANGGNPFNGALDDVRIYNRALSPEEIAELVAPIDCFPSTYPAYDDWLALGKPDCWCRPYHCDGDADGVDSGFPLSYRVFIGDLALIVDNWQKKIHDVTLSPCADIDHKDSGFPFYYRVFTSDLAIIVENWMKKSEELPGNCPRQE